MQYPQLVEKWLHCLSTLQASFNMHMPLILYERPSLFDLIGRLEFGCIQRIHLIVKAFFILRHIEEFIPLEKQGNYPFGMLSLGS